MANVANYSRANQIDLVELSLQKPAKNSVEFKLYDIIDLLDQFIIYEDLLQTNISAKLIFRDQVNLVGSLPIVGGEKITIKYKTPIYDDYITQEFIVGQVGERVISNDASNIQMNQLFLCTPEVWWAVNNDTNSAYEGNYTDIIKKLFSELITEKSIIDSEESIGINKYVTPSWNIFKAIKFCASRANTKSTSPLMFWEAIDGFHLKSLQTTYDTGIKKTIYIQDRGINNNEDADKAFNSLYSYEYLAGNDRLGQYQNNAFGSTSISVDITNARISKSTNDYSQIKTRIGNYQLNDDARNIRSKDEVYLPYRKDLSHTMDFSRQSNYNLMDNTTILVNIPGDSGLYVGDMINMDVPSREGVDITTEKPVSGKWLVRSIKSLISKTTYSQVCELVKDSFEVEVREEY